MKFCVFGAGAVGGFVGGMMARDGDADVSLIARGAHLDAIRTNGLKLRRGDEEFSVSPAATDNPSELGVQDIIFVTAKAHSLGVVAEAMQPLLGPDTVVVAAQNGIPFWYFHAHGGTFDGHTLQTVDRGGRIAELIGCERVIGCVITSSNAVEEPGVVRNIGNQIFALGEPDGSASERIDRVSRTLASCGLEAPMFKDLRNEVWLKLWGNVSWSTMAALTTSRLGPLVEQMDLQKLGVTIMSEMQTVAETLGITFREGIDSRIEGTKKVAGHKTSILQDLEAGRPMEVDGIAGAVVELGRLVNVETPMVDLIYALLRQRARASDQYPEIGFDPLTGQV